jgi:putative SOS response-associated peptidase YedK
VGLDPALVQRSTRWSQADQRQSRKRLKASDVQGCLCLTALHRPVDGFFEWRAIRGAGRKQPYAIARKDASPFGLAGLWENWCDPVTGEWERTFAVITVPSNELVGQIHNRMPAILKPESYERWLGLEPDPHDLLISYPADAMTMWPISTRVNKPENDDPSILDQVAEPVDWQAPLDRSDEPKNKTQIRSVG